MKKQLTEIDNIAVPAMKQVAGEANGVWTNPEDLYYQYRHIQIDKRGSFGERFFTQTILAAFPRRITIEYKDGDQGEWDLKINGFKFEIKTSSLDINNKFQNEGLHADTDYYGVLFLCVSPNQLYFKFVKKECIPFQKLHDRRKAGTGSGYKWDHKLSEVDIIDTIDQFKYKFETAFPEVFKKTKSKTLLKQI